MKVFYNEKQTARGNDSFSPSAQKPAKALAEWKRLHGDKIQVVESGPVSSSDISLAHEHDYVKGVLSQVLPNGFGNTKPEVAESLPYTTGSFYAAAKHAAETGEAAVSPTSGFHHACYHGGGGFCTFNGLMITAIKLKKEGLVNRVGILDLDEHYGNGTDNIIDKLGIDYVSHYTGGAHGLTPAKSEQFLADLPFILDEYFSDVDVLLYQAGADAHVNDPLGGYLDDDQLRRRDKIVFEWCKKNNKPVAWNLAGGYQVDRATGSIQKVLNVHNATMDECLKAFEGISYDENGEEKDYSSAV